MASNHEQEITTTAGTTPAEIQSAEIASAVPGETPRESLMSSGEAPSLLPSDAKIVIKDTQTIPPISIAAADEDVPWPDDEVGELVDKLQHALGATRARNRELRTAIAIAEVRAREAETRTTMAEARAAETQQKLAVLENLKNEGYRAVVTDLFQQPSQEAKSLSIRVAAASILAGVFVSVLVSIGQTAYSERRAIRANQEAARRNTQALETLAESLRQEVIANVAGSETRTRAMIETSEARTKADLKAMIGIMTDPDLRDGGLIELQWNVPIQLAVGANENRYFKVVVSDSTRSMRIMTTPMSGNPDLFIAKGKVPRPGETVACQSTLTGQTQEWCYWAQAPPRGEWFVRVFASGSPSTFKIQVTQ